MFSAKIYVAMRKYYFANLPLPITRCVIQRVTAPDWGFVSQNSVYLNISIYAEIYELVMYLC